MCYITAELIGWLAIVLVGLTCALVLMVVVLERLRLIGPRPDAATIAVHHADGHRLRLAPRHAVHCLLHLWPNECRQRNHRDEGAGSITGGPTMARLDFGLSLVGVWLTDLAFSAQL